MDLIGRVNFLIPDSSNGGETEERERERKGRASETRLKVVVHRLVCMRVHYYVLILYREGTNVRTYVKFLAPAA